MTLLPPNASPLERALDHAVARISDVPTPFRDLWNPATCPVELLPYLAYALSIDSWSSDWPEAVKRRRITQAIAIQRRKGTASSVRDVVTAFGGVIAIREWWQMQPPGDPHTFSLVLNITDQAGAPVDAAFVEAIIAEVYRTKPVRSHFTFSQALNATAGLAPVAAVRPTLFTRLAMTAPAA
ncbi:phage tail P2-like protein [Sphingomonas sp. SORGH_AS870]|uniref:phage tail protein I n=1 Tax=Sphingomonas sp. SORGH_AS_0870 TaxID=3041801 RepID=UPI0028627142|nr:phage tail protein I [Sphingomonas sp. SORGH_AS_0870]MDR6144954.1 phage tail P2-like protein [Sphingomonas sp. SORGH_AS_0870]